MYHNNTFYIYVLWYQSLKLWLTNKHSISIINIWAKTVPAQFSLSDHHHCNFILLFMIVFSDLVMMAWLPQLWRCWAWRERMWCVSASNRLARATTFQQAELRGQIADISEPTKIWSGWRPRSWRTFTTWWGTLARRWRTCHCIVSVPASTEACCNLIWPVWHEMFNKRYVNLAVLEIYHQTSPTPKE